jgi:hypothetical protein
MRTSPSETAPRRAKKVRVTRDSIIVELTDGRTLEVPLSWYPRLQRGTTDERRNWRLVGAGTGIHWPDLDEDISIEGLLAGLPSAESRSSFKQWLASRRKRRRSKRLQPTAAKRRGD